VARTFLSPEFARNYGFWSEDEQKALIRSTVAICGAGGGGFQFGLKLARMGVSGFNVADPETFEPQNANRVDGAAVSTYGRNKAEVFRDRVLDINPDARVAVFTEGVTPHLGVSYSEASSSSKVGESLASPLPSIIDSSSSAFVPRMELAVAASKSVMRRWRRSYRVLNFLVRFFY
jgi:hypothetical protein